MPQLTPPTDFGFSDSMLNRTMLKEVENKSPVVLDDAADYCVLMADQNGLGRIVMKDKRKDSAVYIVEYEVQNIFLGAPVVQITVWRNPDSVLSQGISSKIFNDILLERFHMVMSDAEQTKDAERFWRGRMAEAAARGDRVGLVNTDRGRVTWYEPMQGDYEDWIDGTNGWGEDPSYRNLRYVIAKSKNAEIIRPWA